MSLIVKSSGGNYDPIPEDSYPAVCIGVYDIGRHYNELYEKEQQRVIISWEIIGATKIDSETGAEKNRVHSETYTASWNERSNLRKMLKSWRGKEFTESELEKFDLKNVLGKPCMIQIVHTKKNDRTYSNADSITKLPKAFGDVKAQSDTSWFDCDESPLDEIKGLPEWIQDKIKESITYRERIAGRKDSADQESGNALTSEDFVELDDDGELPF